YSARSAIASWRSFAAIGVICGSRRRSLRNMTSCQCVQYAGCPASDGVPGIVALPSPPWQATHASDFRRPASTSAPRTDADVAINATASNATATGGTREDIGAKPDDNTLAPRQSVGATQVRRNCRRVAIVAPSDERSAVVRDSIDGPGVVVRDEQRAVGHLV